MEDTVQAMGVATVVTAQATAQVTGVIVADTVVGVPRERQVLICVRYSNSVFTVAWDNGHISLWITVLAAVVSVAADMAVDMAVDMAADTVLAVQRNRR